MHRASLGRALVLLARVVVVVVELGAFGIALPEDPAPDPPGKDGAQRVLGVHTVGNGKNVVQLLKRLLLRLGNADEDHGQGDQVEARIETEDTNGLQDRKHARQGHGQNRGPEVVGGDSPRHADLTMRQGEHLGGVHEGNGTFTGRVEGSEEVDKGRDGGDTGVLVVDEVAQTGS